MDNPPNAGEPFVIPDGYVVAVAKQGDESYSVTPRSGIMIADFGPGVYLAGGFEGIEGLLKEDPGWPVMWVLQKAAVEYWTADSIRMATLLWRFHRIKQLRKAGGASKVRTLLFMPPGTRLSDTIAPDPKVMQVPFADAVSLEDTGPSSQLLMILLFRLGFVVTILNAEKQIFFEIQRPDNIVIIGLAGNLVGTETVDQTLLEIYAERDSLLGQLPDSQARLQELEDAELAYIDRLVQEAASLVKQPQTGPGYPLLSSMMGTMTQDELFNFIRLFSQSRVGLKESEPVAGAESSHPTVALTSAYDGRSRLLVCADPPLFQMRYDSGFNVVIDGMGAIDMMLEDPDLAGIYINNALAESSIVIDREQVTEALKSDRPH